MFSCTSKQETKPVGCLLIHLFQKIPYPPARFYNCLDLRFIDCPGPSGVKRIPPTSFRRTSYFALIVLSETIQATVPDGPLPLYERLFGESDPDGNDCEHPKRKFPDIEVTDLLHGSSVLLKPVP